MRLSLRTLRTGVSEGLRVMCESPPVAPDENTPTHGHMRRMVLMGRLSPPPNNHPVGRPSSGLPSLSCGAAGAVGSDDAEQDDAAL